MNGWIEAITRPENSNHSKIIFYSLLNTALNYDPIGWGLPYNYLLFEDTQEEIVDISLQILAVLLNYSSTSHDNIFILNLKEINGVAEFNFIYRGLSTLLNNPIYSKNSYLPASTKEIGCYQEQLIIFWSFITYNRVCSYPFIYFINYLFIVYLFIYF